MPLSFQVPLIGRLSGYFTIIGVIMFPMAYSLKHQLDNDRIGVKERAMLKLSCIVNMIYLIYSYIQFFYSDTYGSHFINFKTIFQ